MKKPVYNKPEAPGIWMNFDNTIALYHHITATDSFEKAAQEMFEMLQEAQQKFPNWQRIFYLDIDNHVDSNGRFAEDFVELQQEFFFACMAPFLTAFELPLVDGLNPNPQRNDIPDKLNITL